MVYRDSINGRPGIIDPPRGSTIVTPEECTDQQNELLCFFDENSMLLGAHVSTVFTTIQLLKNAGLEITSEGVLLVGGFAGTAAVILSYGRALSPWGAFALGLGLTSVAASDYCGIYDDGARLAYFVNHLTPEEQSLELSMCPSLAGMVLRTANQID